MKSDPLTDMKGTPASPATARARGTDQEHAFGDLRPDLLEARRCLQEVDHLADLLLHAGIAGHVLECRRRTVTAELLGLGAADGHDPRHLPLGLAADEVDEGGPDEDDEEVGSEVTQEAGRLRGEADRHAVVAHGGDVVGQRRTRSLGLVRGPVLEFPGDLAGAVADLGRAHLLGRHILHVLGVTDGLVGGPLVGPEDHENGHHTDRGHTEQPAVVLAGRGISRRCAPVTRRCAGLIRGPIWALRTHYAMLCVHFTKW
jgi:hypothetical protein